jgi:hypothetical protein
MYKLTLWQTKIFFNAVLTAYVAVRSGVRGGAWGAMTNHSLVDLARGQRINFSETNFKGDKFDKFDNDSTV